MDVPKGLSFDIKKTEYDDFEYVTEDDVCWNSIPMYVNIEVLGFCGCGDVEDNLEYVLNGLLFIDRKQVDDPFGNELSKQFFYYWADKEKLTDHGYCIPGWLSEKGKALVNDLTILKSKGLLKKEVGER